MKKMFVLITLVMSFCVLAGEREKVEFSASYAEFFETEQEALELGLKVEETIKAGKFKNYRANKCETFSKVKYSTKNVEVKKFYVDGIAKFKTIVNAVMECELEYQM